MDSNTAQDVLALLISKGYAVMAIDSYFNGERRGQGPAGKNEMQEKRADQEMSLFKINLCNYKYLNTQTKKMTILTI